MLFRSQQQQQMQQQIQQQPQSQPQIQQGQSPLPQMQGQPQQVQGDQTMVSPESLPNYMNAPFDQTQGIGFAGNFGGTTPITAAPEMGVTLPQVEGVDYRGLRMPPEGRPAQK